MNIELETPQPTGKTVLILGGGIGGLAAALALTHKGFNVSVFEKFPQEFIVGNGAGLSMVKPVLKIMEEIGVPKELIKEKTNLANKMVLETYKGELIREEQQTTKLSASWSNLYEMLDKSLSPDVVHYAKRIVAIEKLKDGKIKLKDQNGCDHIGDVLVVADGARSVVREILTKKKTMDTLKYTGHLNLRGLIQIEDTPEDRAFEEKLRKYYPKIEDEIYIEFGKHHHTGMQLLPGKKISWWSYVNSKDAMIWPNLTAVGEFLTDKMVKALYQKMNGQVSERLNFIFKHTKEHMVNVITDATIDKWVYDNIILIGDAAHPMTPNCGLAACMAVVDGYTLAGHMANYPNNLRAGFQAYEKARLKLVKKFVVLDHECGQERNKLGEHKGRLSEFDTNYQEAHQLFASKGNLKVMPNAKL